MASIIEVETNELNKDIKKFDTTVNALKNDLKGLDQEIEALDAMWDGVANAAFNAQYQTDSTTLDHMIKSLQEYSDDLKMAKHDYEKCESTVGDMVKAINV